MREPEYFHEYRDSHLSYILPLPQKIFLHKPSDLCLWISSISIILHISPYCQLGCILFPSSCLLVNYLFLTICFVFVTSIFSLFFSLDVFLLVFVNYSIRHFFSRNISTGGNFFVSIVTGLIGLTSNCAVILYEWIFVC